MAYYLTIDKNKKKEILDITNSSKFERLSNFKGNGCSLQEIDLLSTKFSDEVSFKKYLCEEGILDVEDIMKKISIRKVQDGKLEKVKNDLFYNYANKYLDSDYLLLRILSKQDDNNFLDKLCSYYRNSYCNNGTISYIRNLKETRERFGEVPYVIENLPLALTDFVKREIYEIDKRTGEVKVKYKSLHDLATFVFKYVDEEEMLMAGYTEEEIKERTKKELQDLQEKLQYNPKSLPRVRKRVKVKEEIEGQMSLFGE